MEMASSATKAMTGGGAASPLTHEQVNAQIRAAQAAPQLSDNLAGSQVSQMLGVHRAATAGQQVGSAIHPVTPAGTAKPTAGPVGPTPVTLVGGQLTVNFTGKCPHCNSDIHTSANASQVTPTI